MNDDDYIAMANLRTLTRPVTAEKLFRDRPDKMIQLLERLGRFDLWGSTVLRLVRWINQLETYARLNPEISPPWLKPGTTPVVPPELVESVRAALVNADYNRGLVHSSVGTPPRLMEARAVAAWLHAEGYVKS